MEELKKRISFLENELLKKKKIVEKELFQLEGLCKELISLKEKLDKLDGE